jgi:uncharacterized protein
MSSLLSRTLPWLMSCLLLSAPASGRELAVAPDRLIAVELATVAVLTGTDVPVVLLREPESGDVIPIFIGIPEARAILLALRGVELPRPMTHDLLHDVIGKLSGTLERVIVDDLRSNTYHAVLEIRLAGNGELVRIDSRPSDALALAVRASAEIRVSIPVLQAGRDLDFEGLGNEQVVTALGITVVEATPDLREALSLPDREGVIVTAARGVAAFAGMEPGSLILTVNDVVPLKPMDFLELVRKTPADRTASITYWRNGEEHTIELSTDVPRGSRQGVAL